jgi:hypothetical protein
MYSPGAWAWQSWSRKSILWNSRAFCTRGSVDFVYPVSIVVTPLLLRPLLWIRAVSGPGRSAAGTTRSLSGPRRSKKVCRIALTDRHRDRVRKLTPWLTVQVATSVTTESLTFWRGLSLSFTNKHWFSGIFYYYKKIGEFFFYGWFVVVFINFSRGFILHFWCVNR